MALTQGTPGNDPLLVGTPGNDTLQGLGGDDVLNGGLGADVLDGGSGTDRATYEDAVRGVDGVGVHVTVLDGLPTANKGEAAGDTYISIENLTGSQSNDYLAGNDGNNVINGLGGDDTLWGWGGARNELYGGGGVDTLIGTPGIDIMDGGAGTDPLRQNGDTVSYQQRTDTDPSRVGVTASLLDQSINTGHAAGDVYTDMEDLTGSIYDDELHGDNTILDNLDGLAGNDRIFGHGGIDVMIGGPGRDYLHGGDGNDIADYETYRFEEFQDIGAPNGGIVGVTASLLNPGINTFDAEGDTYDSIENMAGSLLDDTLEGNNESNVILAWAGADIVRGMGGNDTLEGMPGADVLDGGAGEDTASYSSAGTKYIESWGFYTQLDKGVTASLLNPVFNTNDALGDTYFGIENLEGSSFADILQGNDEVNALLGKDGADQLQGMGKDDTLEGGAGADSLDGGAGYDTAAYTRSAVGVVAALDGSLVAVTGTDSFGDTYTDVEGLLGSAQADQLAGNAEENTLQGGVGNDSLFGRGGNDLLVGGADADVLDGGDGSDTASYQDAAAGVVANLDNTAANTGDAQGDTYFNIEALHGSNHADTLSGHLNTATTLRGLIGNDTLTGGNADDVLIGDAGSDVLIGGAGADIASYITAALGVTASLAAPNTNTGDALGDTYSGIENLAGSTKNDTLSGDDLRNVLLGLDGADILNGGGGDDGLEGGLGADTLNGGAGQDTAGYGSAVTASLLNADINTGEAQGDTYNGIENLAGSSGSDILQGNDEVNALFGKVGSDQLLGMGGDDTLEGGQGADQLDGGDGYDFASYSNATSNVQLGLDGSLAGFGEAQGDTFVGIEGVLGSNHSDVIFGDAASNTLRGELGDDNLNGGGGDDYLVGGAGADAMTGGDGQDTVSYITATAGVTVSLQDNAGNTGDAQGDIIVGVEFLHGSLHNDTMSGYSFAPSTLRGLAGNDTLNGGFANDILIGDAGADTLNGGEGIDLASYVTAAAGVVANLSNAAANTGDAQGDTYSGIENLAGTNFADQLTGDFRDNIILGLLGDDTLNGQDGNDGLEGGDGNDTLNGGNGADRLSGGTGNDNLNGAEGDDVIIGDTGADQINGGAGTDLLSYERSTSGVSIVLGGGSGTGGDAQGDVVTGIENLIGSAFGDQLTGDGASNRILGREGNDTLVGGGGEDQLEGGAGADTLDGTGGYTYASYTEASSGVSAYLTWMAGNSGDAAGDTYISIEGLVGSAHADVLSGSEVDNTLQSGGGNDWLFGREGSDYLVGGEGNDVLSGGDGNDALDGGTGDDVAYYRDAAEAVFTVAQYGNKTGMVDGRSYGISLDLRNGNNNFGEAAFDQLVNVENLWGSRFDDVIRGADDVSGQVYGFEGNDTLDGGGGDDFFYGGTGNDTLTGGAGVDNFFFLSWNDHHNQWGTLEANEGGDTVTDFEHGVDHIVVSRYWFGFGNIGGPAAALTTAHADFITNGSAATQARPTFIYDAATSQLHFDGDGSGATAAVLMATLQPGATFTLSDIWTA